LTFTYLEVNTSIKILNNLSCGFDVVISSRGCAYTKKYLLIVFKCFKYDYDILVLFHILWYYCRLLIYDFVFEKDYNGECMNPTQVVFKSKFNTL